MYTQYRAFDPFVCSTVVDVFSLLWLPLFRSSLLHLPGQNPGLPKYITNEPNLSIHLQVSRDMDLHRRVSPLQIQHLTGGEGSVIGELGAVYQ